MSQVETRKRERFIASCNFCGGILQEAQGDCKCNVICAHCGKTMAVIIRKGKVTVFEERYANDNSANGGQVRLMKYAAGIGSH